jgi:hypothetical protein
VVHTFNKDSLLNVVEVIQQSLCARPLLCGAWDAKTTQQRMEASHLVCHQSLQLTWDAEARCNVAWVFSPHDRSLVPVHAGLSPCRGAVLLGARGGKQAHGRHQG